MSHIIEAKNWGRGRVCWHSLPREGNIVSMPKNTDQNHGLKQGALSFSEVFAQSVANIAPSATPALIIPLVFASAGNITWLAYAVATAAMLFVTAQINTFAKRSASPGALYTFTTQGLGQQWGTLSGWALFLAYIFTASATIAGFTNYASVVLTALFHLQSGIGLELALMIGCVVLCAAVAWKDVQLSTRAMLLLEFAAVSLIIVLVLFFFRSGKVVDLPQLQGTGGTFQGLRMALVLAIFSFVGFESATALGEEAKSPLQSIPKSVFFSVLTVGLFFTAVSYVLVLAFRSMATPLDKSASPLLDLANVSGLPQLGIPLVVGAMIGQAACGLASINAASRVMYSMAKHGFFHSSTARTHHTHATPHIAVLVSAFVAGFMPIVLLARGVGSMDIFGYLGTIATFGFLLSYVLVSIAAPTYLKKRNELRFKEITTAVIAVLLLLIPIVGSIYPVPDAPYSYLPYIFLVLIAAGALRSFWLKKTTSS